LITVPRAVGCPKVALSAISHGLKCVADGTYTKESNEYPVVRMHECEVAPAVDGVAAGKSVEI
jgi:hypothetical protein